MVFGTYQKEIMGAEAETTNNRMELTAAIEGLNALKEKCTVILHTDSAYLHNAFTKGWIDNWQKNGWKTASKKPVENKDLWTKLIQLAEKHRVVWRKVKGHADNELNNLADKLCVEARQQKFGV